ncbi:hypothetical protein [Ancylomarina longa]|uniref:Cupin domain-containing protein n=1 Tax=Ancylomarina longa TaxID=2487017 RepID=A0A434AFJ1_9BACT|nr:hypothetical protein [Ancylomarina longa]RUT73118.1 hypothetical protein DLK05_15065 [Ancylomarina longa]
MEILDFTKIAGFPYAERQKNVLYKTDDFKIRIIDLPENGTISECDMIAHVVFVVMYGQVDVTVNGKEYRLSEKQSLASEPATFSMRTENGAKLMGIQIQKHEK